MPAYYLDTSALAKRYIVEVGSAWVQAIVAEQSGQTIYTSVLTQPELVECVATPRPEGSQLPIHSSTHKEAGETSSALGG